MELTQPNSSLDRCQAWRRLSAAQISSLRREIAAQTCNNTRPRGKTGIICIGYHGQQVLDLGVDQSGPQSRTQPYAGGSHRPALCADPPDFRVRCSIRTFLLFCAIEADKAHGRTTASQIASAVALFLPRLTKPSCSALASAVPRAPNAAISRPSIPSR